MLLKNKTAVITGCNRGIGKRILEIFSENGASVFACVRNINDEFKLYVNDLEKKFANKITPIKLEQIKAVAAPINTINGIPD